jgi:hypothetical protein
VTAKKRPRAGAAWLAATKDAGKTRQRLDALRQALAVLGTDIQPNAWLRVLDSIGKGAKAAAEDEESRQRAADLQDALHAYAEGRQEALQGQTRQFQGLGLETLTEHALVPALVEVDLTPVEETQEATKAEPQTAAPTEEQPEKKRPKKRRHRKLTPLTAKQKMTLDLWVAYRGHITRVAEHMKIDHKTARQHLLAAFKKLGEAETRLLQNRVRKTRYQKLPEDGADQVMLSDSEPGKFLKGKGKRSDDD